MNNQHIRQHVTTTPQDAIFHAFVQEAILGAIESVKKTQQTSVAREDSTPHQYSPLIQRSCEHHREISCDDEQIKKTLSLVFYVFINAIIVTSIGCLSILQIILEEIALTTKDPNQ